MSEPKQGHVDNPTSVIVCLLHGSAARSPLNEGSSSLVYVRFSISHIGPKIWRF